MRRPADPALPPTAAPGGTSAPIGRNGTVGVTWAWPRGDMLGDRRSPLGAARAAEMGLLWRVVHVAHVLRVCPEGVHGKGLRALSEACGHWHGGEAWIPLGPSRTVRSRRVLKPAVWPRAKSCRACVQGHSVLRCHPALHTVEGYALNKKIPEGGQILSRLRHHTFQKEIILVRI